ncbi:MAG: hypothetical protein AAF557_15875 [Pseudomonadota bacterium]
MSFRRFAILTAIAMPAAALAQVYGTPEGCAMLAGTPPQSDTAWVLTPAELRAHESTCNVIENQTLDSGKSRITASCSGEGAEWTQAYILESTADVDKKIFYPEVSPNFPTEFKACE